MQEKMTASREEIDALQGKIQQLEEALEQQRQVKTFELLREINTIVPSSIPRTLLPEKAAPSPRALLASLRSISGEVSAALGAAAAAPATQSRQEGEETAEGGVGGSTL